MPNTSASGGYLTPKVAVSNIIPHPAYDNALIDIVGNMIAGITGIDRNNYVRPRWQPEPPVVPAANINWVAFGALSIEKFEEGDPYILHDDTGEGHDELTQHEVHNILVSFYGPAALHYAALLRDGLHIVQNWEEARGYKMALRSIGAIQFVPEQLNNIWYTRADIEVGITREIARSYDVKNILEAEGTITGNDVGGRVITEDWNTENV